MGYYCGVDIGAGSTKLVLLDENHQLVAKASRRSGVDYPTVATACRDEALESIHASPSDILASLATGYGRDNVPFADGKMTEIACHAKGAYSHYQRAMTVIDIGAQDSKVIHLDEAGRRQSFKMNRKCAAGTGAFLEEIAYRLDLSLDTLDDLASRSSKDVTLGSFCTVFAATEILAKIRAGERVEDIVMGAFRSVVKRIVEMDYIDGALVMTGGVAANNPTLVRTVAEAFDREILVPPNAQFAGALGAALFAASSH